MYRLEKIGKDFQVGSVVVSALKEVSFEIPAGGFLSLCGPSGSGKSTLLNVLGLIERPTRGTLSFFDDTVSSFSEQELTEIRRERIGVVFQNFNLIPVMSAMENVEYPLLLKMTQNPREIRQTALEALSSVGLEKFARHRPSELSGGQRQRVAIARALVKKPSVVIADEPTANLDSENARQVLELLRDLRKKYQTTVIVATHDSQLAALADEVVRLRDGSIV